MDEKNTDEIKKEDVNQEKLNNCRNDRHNVSVFCCLRS